MNTFFKNGLVALVLGLLWTSCQKDDNSNLVTINGKAYNKTTGISTDSLTFIDFRDSIVYGIKRYGTQLWHTQNLRYATTSGSWTNPGNPSIDYGRLYTWDAAMNGAAASSTNPSAVRGICPDGWHLPSDTEWSNLEISLGMSASDAQNLYGRGTHDTIMKSTTGWSNNNNGSNGSGLNVYPAGEYNSSNSTFEGLGTKAVLLSTTEWFSPTLIKSRVIDGIYTGVSRDTLTVKTRGYSCRCLQD